MNHLMIEQMFMIWMLDESIIQILTVNYFGINDLNSS